MNPKVLPIDKGLTLFILVFLPFLSIAQLLPENWSQANGTVNKAVYDEVNNRMILAGSFSWLSAETPSYYSGCTFDVNSGEYTPIIPVLDGAINVSVEDGNGGLFIGGSFTSIGGYSRNGIAHLDANGTITTWDAGITGNCNVKTIAIYGSKLYVGGIFNSVQGQSNVNIVVLDKVSGSIIPWVLSCSSGVSTLKAYNGYVYAGSSYGTFSCSSCPSATGAARIDTLSGLLDGWNPNVNGSVKSFEFDNNYVYLGGLILQVNGQNRTGLARVLMSDASLDSWNPFFENIYPWCSCTPDVSKIEKYGNELIVGGEFSAIDGNQRTHLASFNLSSSSLSSWNPQLDAAVDKFLINGQNLFIGGGFWFVNNEIHQFFAKIDLPTKEVASWNPHLDGAGCIAMYGNDLFIGGGTIQTDVYVRPGLAAIDLNTGKPTDWKPIPDLSGEIYDLAIQDSILYVGGRFNNMDNQPRNNLAAYSLNTGELLVWNPDADTAVNTLCVTDDMLLVGGEFTTVAGASRNHIAAFDLTNGSLNGIDLGANGTVFTIKEIGSHVYIGGLFTEIGGQQKENLARFLTSTYAFDTSWLTKTNGKVSAICGYEDRILIGGDFTSLNDSVRNNLGAVNYTTGYIQPQDISVDGPVLHIGKAEDRVFILGSFQNIGGQNRPMMAELDVENSLITPWYLPVDPWPNTGKSMLQIDSILIFTGSFRMALDSTDVPDYSMIPTEVNQFVLPSIPGICNGTVYLTAQGAPDFDFFIDENFVGTSVSFLSPDSLCPGIYSLSTVNYFGDTTYEVLAIPADTNYFLINPFSNEIINDLLGYTLENCELDYNLIDTIFIEDSYVNNDTIVAIWHIELSSNIYTDTILYPLTSGNGYYYLQIGGYCPNRATSDVFTATQGVIVAEDSVYLDIETQVFQYDLIVSPNPTNNTVTISTTLPEVAAELYDLQGKMMKSVVLRNNDKLSLEEYDCGIYLLKFETPKGIVLKRIIKQ